MAPTRSQTRAEAIQEEKNRKRQTNFSKEEDLFLCRAFVNVSQDPIKGNDRKGSTFWADVKIKFDAIFLEEAEDPLAADAWWISAQVHGLLLKLVTIELKNKPSVFHPTTVLYLEVVLSLPVAN